MMRFGMLHRRMRAHLSFLFRDIALRWYQQNPQNVIDCI